MSKLNRVQQWVNNLVTCIPKAIFRQLRLEQNTSLEETIVDGKLSIEVVHVPVYDLEKLLEGVTPDNLYEEIDTGHPLGKEIW